MTSATTTVSPATQYSLEIGLTKRGLDEVGDLICIKKLLPIDHSAEVRPGDALLRIDWEGHAITRADELYHTVWETMEGETRIRSPVYGTINHILVCEDDDVLDEDTVLIRMTSTMKDLEEEVRRKNLANERDYFRLLQYIPPGKFSG